MKSAFCGARLIDRAIFESAVSHAPAAYRKTRPRIAATLATLPAQSTTPSASSHWPEAVVILGLGLSAGWTLFLGYALINFFGSLF